MSADPLDATQRSRAPLPASSWVAGRGCVDIWRVDLGRVAPRRLDALSEVERQRAKRKAKLRGSRLPSAFGRSRAALREVLGHYLEVPPARVELAIGDHNRPVLAQGAASELDFNLSHTGEHALIAVGNGARVGIDLERVDASRDIAGLARRFFHDEERESVLASEDPVRTFYRLWTCKEAYLKAIGTGLARSLRSFEVRLGATPGRAFVVDSERATTDELLLCELQLEEVEDKMTASVCALGPVGQLRVFDASEWLR